MPRTVIINPDNWPSVDDETFNNIVEASKKWSDFREYLDSVHELDINEKFFMLHVAILTQNKRNRLEAAEEILRALPPADKIKDNVNLKFMMQDVSDIDTFGFVDAYIGDTILKKIKGRNLRSHKLVLEMQKKGYELDLDKALAVDEPGSVHPKVMHMAIINAVPFRNIDVPSFMHLYAAAQNKAALLKSFGKAGGHDTLRFLEDIKKYLQDEENPVEYPKGLMKYCLEYELVDDQDILETLLYVDTWKEDVHENNVKAANEAIRYLVETSESYRANFKQTMDDFLMYIYKMFYDDMLRIKILHAFFNAVDLGSAFAVHFRPSTLALVLEGPEANEI